MYCKHDTNWTTFFQYPMSDGLKPRRDRLSPSSVPNVAFGLVFGPAIEEAGDNFLRRRVPL